MIATQQFQPQMRPQQYQYSYSPYQTTTPDMSGIIGMIMPIMMLMLVFSMISPMMKGVTQSTK